MRSLTQIFFARKPTPFEELLISHATIWFTNIQPPGRIIKIFVLSTCRFSRVAVREHRRTVSHAMPFTPTLLRTKGPGVGMPAATGRKTCKAPLAPMPFTPTLLRTKGPGVGMPAATGRKTCKAPLAPMPFTSTLLRTKGPGVGMPAATGRICTTALYRGHIPATHRSFAIMALTIRRRSVCRGQGARVSVFPVPVVLEGLNIPSRGKEGTEKPL